jgi:hypothetical protein
MLKVRRANFLDFYAINTIYKKYFKMEFGGKNTNLLYQFILLLLNDFLKFFSSNFLEIYYLEKNGKIIGVCGYYILSRNILVDYGICIIPKEREKGLAKFLVKKSLKLLENEGMRYWYFLTISKSLVFIKKPKAKFITNFYHYGGKWKTLKNVRLHPIQLYKYKTDYFPLVFKLIKSTAKNNSIFTLLFFRPPKNKLSLFLEKAYFLMGFGKVWKYCIKEGERIVGYVEITYYPHLRELKIYLLLKEKIDYLLDKFNEVFKQNNIPISNLDLHIFVKFLKKEKIFLEGFKRRNLFEMRISK